MKGNPLTSPNSLPNTNTGHWTVSKRAILLIFLSAFILGFLFLGWLKFSVAPNYWPIGVDVYPLWVGTQAFWSHQSPYSPEIDLQTQAYVYGRPATPEEDSFGFYYPAYVAVILAPLSLITVELAAILWPSFMWAIWVTSIAAITLLMPKRLSPLLWALVIFSLLLYRPFLLSVLNGQYGIIVVGCLILSWLMIQRERDFIAGVFLALATIKPSLAMIPVALAVVWSLFTGRARVALGVVCSLGVLLLVSFTMIGWWIPEFIQQLGEYSRNLGNWTGKDIFTLPGLIWLIASAILIGLGYYEYRIGRKFPYNLFLGGILINLAITPHTLEYDLVILVLPLLFLMPVLSKSVLGYTFFIVLLWAPWISWLFFTMADISIETWWKAI